MQLADAMRCKEPQSGVRTGEERCEPVRLVQQARRGACSGVVRQAAVQVPRQQLAQG